MNSLMEPLGTPILLVRKCKYIGIKGHLLFSFHTFNKNLMNKFAGRNHIIQRSNVNNINQEPYLLKFPYKKLDLRKILNLRNNFKILLWVFIL